MSYPNGQTSTVVSGTPAESDVGTIVVAITASDNIGGTFTGSFSLRIDATPTSTTITAPSAQEGHAYTYTIPATHFDDADCTDTLTYSQITLPNWVSFTAGTINIAGTPAAANIGSNSVTIRATDNLGAYNQPTFTVTVVPNNPPTITTIPDQVAFPTTVYSLDVSSYFADADGDTLLYTGDA